jgi:hypothetical protein
LERQVRQLHEALAEGRPCDGDSVSQFPIHPTTRVMQARQELRERPDDEEV